MKLAKVIVRVSLDSNKHSHTAINVGAIPWEAYALVITDLVRHIARAYRIDEKEVWRLIDKERNFPTTKITGNRVGEN